MAAEKPKLQYLPLLLFQLLLMVLYFVFVKYDPNVLHDTKGYEGTHVMIFIGFGFLMTFLKKYCYTALGFNWLLAALVVQWAVLCQSFYHMEDNTIYIHKETLMEGDIMSATVLITFGALLGVASGLQLLLIAVIETVVGSLNLWLVGTVFQAADVGGSIAIHAYGAYFGLGASLALRKKKAVEASEESLKTDLNCPEYMTDVTAMIGSIFLWVYWPSFNSGLTKSDNEYQMAVVNTYLALAAATVTSFVMSSMLSHNKGKFDMVHIQNSTLAGGVAVGSICNMHIGPGGAIAVGIASGLLSVLGYRYLAAHLTKYGILDTCGVNNLHGMPGVLSGILSAVVAAFATEAKYGDDLKNVFPAMGTGRTASDQALYQLAALGSTLVISLTAGYLTGCLAKLPMLRPLKENEKYDDEVNWELPC